ncbi:hypothetical protein AGR5A_Lc100028 [Agrobacterium genomosp. 5 str. CFBP 6626]|nr:hypothetical protein AGR5A_Lc100028 [Agrobacterium genomosp. 5 str. CFBP 6626]
MIIDFVRSTHEADMEAVPILLLRDTSCASWSYRGDILTASVVWTTDTGDIEIGHDVSLFAVNHRRLRRRIGSAKETSSA